MRWGKRTWNWTVVALALLSGLTLFPQNTHGEPDRIELLGAYRYFYRDPMSVEEAKGLTCAEAVRLAVESSPLFIEATTDVVDSQLVRDLAQKIATGYAKDVQVLEQASKGRTVSCKVRTAINPDEVKTVIARELSRAPVNGLMGIDQNRALKIVAVHETEDEQVEVVFRALKRLDWLTTAYPGSLQAHADIMIEFYDEHGVLLAVHKFPARKASSDDVMNPGQIGALKVPKPHGTKSYRAWVVK